jgi:flagellar motility protein MotE (MotC chaperone)
MLVALGILGIILVVATIGWTIVLDVPYKVLFSEEERQKMQQEAQMAAGVDMGAMGASVPSSPMAPPVGAPPLMATSPAAPVPPPVPSSLSPILAWQIGPEGVGKSVEQLAMEQQQSELDGQRQELERLRQEIQLERTNLEADRQKIDSMLGQLRAILGTADSVRTSRVGDLVKIYSTMRPADAAAGLQALANREDDLTIVAEVIKTFKDRQAGRVMAAFDTTFQAQISQIIGNPFATIK